MALHAACVRLWLVCAWWHADMAAAQKLGLRADWSCREKGEGESTCQVRTVMHSVLVAAHDVVGRN